MDQTERVLAKAVRPFWGRVAVLPSPVDEIETGSGIVIPLEHEDDAGVERGVVFRIDESWNESQPQQRTAAEQLSPGTVVWYRGGVRVRDVVVLEMSEIYAFEDAD